MSDYELHNMRTAHTFVYEAYVQTKLGRHDQVAGPARQGLEGINRGKGIDPIPERNALEYKLVDVLIAPADYRLKPDDSGREIAQQALADYKAHNFTYGRGDYRVIFDLQFSYSDVFSPVLPGPDPDTD
jgi:hypothetical protein